MLELKTNFEDIKPLDVLGGLQFPADYKALEKIDISSRINIITGANNTGKSLLLRSIIKSYFNIHFSNRLLEEISMIFLTINSKSGKIHLNDKGEITKENLKELSYLFVKGILDKTVSSKVGMSNNNLDTVHGYRENKKQINEYCTMLMNYSENLSEKLFIFVPTTRSLIRSITNNNWEQSIKSQHDLKDEIIVINGHDFYSIIKNQRNSYNYEDIDRIDTFQKLLSDYIFDGRRVLIVAPVEEKHKDNGYKNELYLKIGNEEQRPIYEFGEGIQHLIILLWHLLQYKQGIVLIEEPELHLHPGHQRQFTRILKEHPSAQNFIYFITTHSNHILDALNYYNELYTLYHTKKQDGQLSVSITNPDKMKDVLDSIGVMNSSVLLANCTIWVEGYSDYIY